MISNVTGGEYLLVSSYPGSSPYINNTQPLTGMMRYHNNSLQTYDGSTWMTVGGGSATISLTTDAVSILNWAKQKMLEEREMTKLAETNPTIGDLVRQRNNIEDQIKMVSILLKKEQAVT